MNQAVRADDPAGFHYLRAIGGALLFSLPLMMTMEMWEFGVTIPPLRMVLLLLVSVPFLIVIARYFGTEPTETWTHHVVDAGVGFAIATGVVVAVLWILGQLSPELALSVRLGRIAVLAIPAAMGSLLTVSEFNLVGSGEGVPLGRTGRQVLMAIGAVYFSLNIAPTEEVPFLAEQMSVWQLASLALLSVLIMEVFLVDEEHREHLRSRGASRVAILLEHTAIGLAIALAIALFMLWMFGKLDQQSLESIVAMTIVLGFPATIGAAASRVLI